MPYKSFASEILYIAKKAGEVINYYYQQDSIDVSYKNDESPVTKADRAADKLIQLALSELTPDIPIISEENEESHASIFDPDSHLFWLVDPLDGTKSFIKKKGEFTVNIALIKNGIPVGGVIYIPTVECSYFTAEDGKAYKQEGNNLPQNIMVRRPPSNGLTAVTSKSHLDEKTEAYIHSIDKLHHAIPAASSLKFCMLAEGKADIYPRFSPTMEWDTAAGHAILAAAGGSVITPETQKPLQYNKEQFKNQDFIAKGAL